MRHLRIDLLLASFAGLLVTFAVLAGAEAAGLNITGQLLEAGQRVAGPPPMALGLYQAPAPSPIPGPNTSHLPGILNNAPGGW